MIVMLIVMWLAAAVLACRFVHVATKGRDRGVR